MIDDTYMQMMLKGCCPGTLKKITMFCSYKTPIALGTWVMYTMR